MCVKCDLFKIKKTAKLLIFQIHYRKNNSDKYDF